MNFKYFGRKTIKLYENLISIVIYSFLMLYKKHKNMLYIFRCNTIKMISTLSIDFNSKYKSLIIDKTIFINIWVKCEKIYFIVMFMSKNKLIMFFSN